MDYIYSERWLSGTNRPLNPMSEAAARKKFVKTKGRRVHIPLYIACFEEPYQEGMKPFVELLTNRLELDGELNRFVWSEFFTPGLSVEISFTMDEAEPGRLFLRQINEYVYPSKDRFYDLNECTKMTQYLFSPEGVVQERVDDSSRETIQTVSRKGVDVSRHWTDVPEFGDWERFTRVREDLFPQ